MSQWEYCKIDLTAVPRQSTDIDVLNQLGKDGWELVNVLANHVAYLKRPLAASVPPKIASRKKSVASEAEKV